MGLLSRSARRTAGPIALVVLLVLMVAPSAWASTPFVDIHSAGPLSDIYIGNDLGCQVRSGGFSSTEFFPNAAGPGDCGTFLFFNSDTIPQQLSGPDFANHPGGTNTTGNFPLGEVPFTSASGNQSLTGTGTQASPLRATTTVTATATNQSGGIVSIQITETDSYVVGNDFYETDLSLKNVGNAALDNGAELYRAGDCLLRGKTTGFGAPEPNSQAPNTGACTPNVLGNPPSALEEFIPITTNTSWEQQAVPTLWGDLNGNALLDECNSCRGTANDNGMAIEYNVGSLSPGQTAPTISFETRVSDTVPTGGLSLSGAAGSTLSGTVATITDPNTSATASAYSATINWGDGTSSTGTITGGNGTFDVAGSRAYSAAGTYPVAVTITSVGTSQGSSTVNDTATITAPPATVTTAKPTVSATGAGFSGTANPNGLVTTAFFQYGLDPKYTGGGPVVYTNSTAPQPVGSDFTTHTVATSVSGLVPNAVYHVRMVATNSAGTSFGPDITFTTARGAVPSPPTLGKNVNVSLVTGVVLIKLHGVFVPLTELSQIPTNTLINALHGTIKLTTAVPGSGGGAHDAAAKGKKPKKVKTQTGTFGGAVFKITQAHSGLATLALVEGAFKGAPTYATCTAHKAADATIASSRTLQLLHSSAHGKFRTRGRYSAATVRGTKWTVSDRCDGTLTHDITDSVAVSDFVHHKTIILHGGQSYLAKAPKHK